jgi:hypothetical protein
MTINYWISTKSNFKILNKPIDAFIANYLIENQGIDVALLAADLGIARNVISYLQLRLGLRKYAPCGRRKSIR